MTRKQLLLWTTGLAAISFSGLFLGSAGPVLPWRPLALILLSLGFLGALPVTVPFFLALAALVVMVFRRERWRALRMFALAVTWFVVTISTAFVGYALGQHVRMKAFHQLAANSRDLVAAIEEFTREVGRPPDSLAELTPSFLPQMPSTGMGAYPSYSYFVGESASRFDGNPWVLLVDCYGPGPSFDTFLYFPLQTIPAQDTAAFSNALGSGPMYTNRGRTATSNLELAQSPTAPMHQVARRGRRAVPSVSAPPPVLNVGRSDP
jgi:hypothetical protein